MREVSLDEDVPFAGIEPGDTIRFNHKGMQFAATVNKVQRSTVSVENPTGGSPDYWNVARTAIREVLP